MTTNIKISWDKLHSQELQIIKGLSGFGLNFDITSYKVVWGGNIEEGLNFMFFDDLDPLQIEIIHNYFKSISKVYGCAYLDCSNFKGCILEYLGGVSCGVSGIWKNKLEVVIK